MRKKLLLLALLFTAIVNAQNVSVPDAAFKAKLLEADITNIIAFNAAGNAIKIDSNNDGEIQNSEALAVSRLRIWNSSILDLTGISSFTNLKNLDCTNNYLLNLDVSSLANLVTLNCSGNFIGTLDVSASPNLTQLFCDGNRLSNLNINGLTKLTLLYCSNNQLTNLNLTGTTDLNAFIGENNKLTTLNINGLLNLKTIICNNNKLASLNVSSATNLEDIHCGHNLLTSLDVSALPNLTQLNCFYNQITNLEVSNATKLKVLSCGENSIATLNLNNLTALTTLECSYLPNNLIINGANLNALKNFLYTGTNSVITLNGFPAVENLNLSLAQANVTLNVSGFNPLANLYLFGNPTTSLTINGSGVTKIKAINCSNSQLTSLNLNGLSDLNSLICNNNKLTTLDLSNLSHLEYLDFSRNKITEADLSLLPNLKHLNVSNNKLTSLNVSGLSGLEYLDCSSDASTDIIGNQLTELNVTGLTNLTYLDCSNYLFDNVLGAAGNRITSLDLNHLIHLEQLKLSKNRLASLIVDGLTSLTTLDCSYNLLTNLDLNGLTNITNLNYAHNQLSNLNMTGLVKITELDCSHNNISTLNVEAMPNLTRLNCSNNKIVTLGINGLNQLANLYCDNNQITALDVNSFLNLTEFSCNSNQLTTLEVNNLTKLVYFQCNGNHLTTINVSALTNLVNFTCSFNQLTSVDVLPLTKLVYFQCDNNQLTTLDVNTLTNLVELNCGFNQLSTIDVTPLTHLRSLICAHNQLTTLDLHNAPDMEGLYCNDNQIATLDVSVQNKLMYLWCQNNALATLFLKNGSNEVDLRFADNPALTYICADDAQLASVQTALNNLGMNATVSNSYCSISPGGPHNTVIGTTIFDGNNNGCNLNDPLHPNIRIDISDGAAIGSAFTNAEGISTFYTQAGNFDIYPNIENAAAFNISPAAASISFPDDNYNTSNQSFCLSANGVLPDLEIVISPVTPARPGFEATYRVVYKNKGNQVLSGTVTLAFDDAKLNLLSAQPAAAAQTTNNLSWDYGALLPFESRVIELVFKVNSPQESPAVNNGDVVNFVTAITPVTGDITPADNTFAFNQIVVGAFDPNDITCLEGQSVSPGTIGDYLHYTVNFENTGTYAAETVIVKVVIDESKYNIHSLQLLDTSHPSQTIIRGNVVEFVFSHINLVAPPVAQVTAKGPPVGGHGSILFKIQTLDNLISGDKVEKQADIFFDYNAPIETNKAETVFQSLGTKDFEMDKSITLYPNPTTGNVTINCDNTIKKIELFDVQGRILQTKIEDSNATQLNISNRANGLYFVRITTANGTKVEKVIKE
ncbi:T9SS type A sorting domain-containing protein [Flavobacterium sp. ENC]|uniref:DUF7619 domain-containing protein n=1 Tax=Flavobacterium sp. ENC TaxID=2897330 RepID=UPI001E46A1EF|nr:T9SS type A sorting domain-containing protein [Flavobacterium sp. ENC]MCD0465173.1 leucine-rich repeat domain-containing protein [Flavobacterium sp. ENC]